MTRDELVTALYECPNLEVYVDGFTDWVPLPKTAVRIRLLHQFKNEYGEYTVECYDSVDCGFCADPDMPAKIAVICMT